MLPETFNAFCYWKLDWHILIHFFVDMEFFYKAYHFRHRIAGVERVVKVQLAAICREQQVLAGPGRIVAHISNIGSGSGSGGNPASQPAPDIEP